MTDIDPANITKLEARIKCLENEIAELKCKECHCKGKVVGYFDRSMNLWRCRDCCKLTGEKCKCEGEINYGYDEKLGCFRCEDCDKIIKDPY